MKNTFYSHSLIQGSKTIKHLEFLDKSLDRILLGELNQVIIHTGK